MKEKRRRLVVIGLIALALLMIGGTLAAWYAESPSIHVINTGRLTGEIVEVYNPPAQVNPGMTVEKRVNVKNTGGVDMLVRVSVEKIWGDKNNVDGSGNVIPDPALSTDNIHIVMNTSKWWYNQSDGYYYYKGIVKPGQTTVEPLFTEFTVDKSTGNEYKNKRADIIVTMECIQYAGNAVQAEWGVTYSQLSVAVPAAPTSRTTNVRFVSPTAKFSFDPATTDLFANFKDLVPGETRQQTISVGNSYNQAVEIFLRAEYVDQTLATTQNMDRVLEMLQKYAQIEVRDSSGKLIYKGAVWGNYPAEPTGAGTDSMKYNISLGTFASNVNRNLTVTLTLDPSMDNLYQDLWGRIKWVFVAMGDDPVTPSTPRPTRPPSTPRPTRNPNNPDYVPDGNQPIPLGPGPGTDELLDDDIPLGMPGTGTENNQIRIMLIALLCVCVVLVAVYLVRRRKRA